MSATSIARVYAVPFSETFCVSLFLFLSTAIPVTDENGVKKRKWWRWTVLFSCSILVLLDSPAVQQTSAVGRLWGPCVSDVNDGVMFLCVCVSKKRWRHHGMDYKVLGSAKHFGQLLFVTFEPIGTLY